MNVIKPIAINQKETIFDNALAGLDNLALNSAGALFTSTIPALSGNSLVNIGKGSRIGFGNNTETAFVANTTGACTVTCTFPVPVLVSHVILVGTQSLSGPSVEPDLDMNYRFRGNKAFTVEAKVGGSWGLYSTYTGNTRLMVSTSVSNPGDLVEAVRVTATIYSGTGTTFELVSFEVYGQPENWSALTTYGVAKKVTYQNDIYGSLYNTNLGFLPTNSQYWQKLYAINKYNCINGIVGISTEFESSIGGSVTIPVTVAFNSFALLGVQATKVVITAYYIVRLYNGSNTLVGSSGGLVSGWTPITVNLSQPDAKNPRVYNLIFDGLPSIDITRTLYLTNREEYDVYLKVEILPDSGVQPVQYPLLLDNLFVGNNVNLGLSQYGASSGISDYSVKTTDQYGNVSLLKRAFSKKLNVDVEIANSEVSQAQKILNSLRATPVVWYSTKDMKFDENLIIYGYFKDFSTKINYPNHSLCSLEIEGMAQN